MKIRNVCLSDISAWVSLSKEYDKYVEELVPNLTEWYEGNDTSISFDKYMRAKIKQEEAFMATDGDNNCRGIIAISKTHNRITFFGVSHKYDFDEVGELLLDHALSYLSANGSITANIIKSNAEQIRKEQTLFNKYGFEFLSDGLENGVPVSCVARNPNKAQ